VPYTEDKREARQIYWRNRYESLKARGRCIACGRAFKDTGVRCEDCRIKASGANARWRKKRKSELLAEIERLRAEVAELKRRLHERDPGRREEPEAGADAVRAAVFAEE
jgi:hypothetical protein